MLGRFFNSFYYGKSGKGDYTPEDMPVTRVQLFFEVLRVRWSAMIRLNLLYVLFWLPALLWTGFNLLALMGVAEEAYQLAEATGAAIDQGQAMSLLYAWLLVLWPCIAITGPATAGVSYVTRNWARDQHSFMGSDFKDAMRANWKQALIISTITGAVPFVVFACYQFYGQMASSNMLFLLPQALVIIVAFIWMLALQLIYTLMVTYELSLGQILRNAVILAMGRLPLSLGIRLLALAIPAIAIALGLLIPGILTYAILVLALYYLLFGLVFSRFLYASYANATCDRYINPRIEGAPVNRGLREVTDDDYEIDPTLPQPPAARDEQGGTDAPA